MQAATDIMSPTNTVSMYGARAFQYKFQHAIEGLGDFGDEPGNVRNRMIQWLYVLLSRFVLVSLNIHCVYICSLSIYIAITIVYDNGQEVTSEKLCPQEQSFK